MSEAACTDVIDALCPMHLRVDASGTLRHVGPTLRKVVGDVRGRALFDVLQVDRPFGLKTLPALLDCAGRKLHLTGPAAPETPLVAHLVPACDGGAILNVGFGIGVAQAVQRHGLTGSDLAPTDLTMEILFLIEAQGAAMRASRRLNHKLQSARLAAEAEAATDTLTGLANRRAAQLTLDALAEDGAPFGLVHLDLDHFKEVNDSHGHAAGDAVLRATAAMLRRLVRPQDSAARIGGDEFLLIFPDLGDAASLGALCDRLIAQIRTLELSDAPLARISASAGIAIWPGGPGADPEALIDRADRALYASKHAGRGRATLVDTVSRADPGKAKPAQDFWSSGLDPHAGKP